MPVGARIANVSSIIKAAAALMAMLPGVATLLGIVAIPPSIDTLIKFISFFVGFVSLLAVVLMGERIAQVRASFIACAAFVMAITGAASATEYYLFANKHIIHIGDTDFRTHAVLLPIRPSKDIDSIILPYQGDYEEALEASNMRFRLMDLLQRESGGTVLVLAVLLVIAQSCSTTAVVLGAWRISA